MSTGPAIANPPFSEGLRQSASAAPEVGAVIVSYNSAREIETCLSSLAAQPFGKLFVVIVDNCSPDQSGKSLAALARRFPFAVTTVLSPENCGFAAGANIGIKNCLARGAEFVWLLNPDTACRPDALDALLEAARQNPGVAAFGSKIVYGQKHDSAKDGSKDIIWGAGGSIDFESGTTSMRGTGETDAGQYNQAELCSYLPGCSLFIRKSAISALGYLPEDYFLYFEETAWCAAAIRAGQKLLFVPQSVVEHYVVENKMQQPYVVFFYNRNERRFWYRFGNGQIKKQVLKNLLFRSIPSSIRGYLAASDSSVREVFAAHLLSALDLFFPGWGQRAMLRRMAKRRPVSTSPM